MTINIDVEEKKQEMAKRIQECRGVLESARSECRILEESLLRLEGAHAFAESLTDQEKQDNGNKPPSTK